MASIRNIKKSDKYLTVDYSDFSHLHEFMHHYDHYYLRLPDSVHCKGFESRIRDLRRKLAS